MTDQSLHQPAQENKQAWFRIAAIGDLHLHAEIPDALVSQLCGLEDSVDALVVAGDITEGGKIPEVELAAQLFDRVSVPIFAVLGNHDRRGLRRKVMRALLESSGIRLLDGDAIVHTFPDGRRLGLAGVGGYGGGFWPEEAPDLIHTRLSKAVGVRARREALRLEMALAELDDSEVDAKIVVLHYSPTASTLGEEPLIKYWMLGNSLLGRVIDDHDVDLVVHGHAHLGNHIGATPGGTPVRNVASHVIRTPAIFDLEPGMVLATLTPELEPVVPGLSCPQLDSSA